MGLRSNSFFSPLQLFCSRFAVDIYLNLCLRPGTQISVLCLSDLAKSSHSYKKQALFQYYDLFRWWKTCEMPKERKEKLSKKKWKGEKVNAKTLGKKIGVAFSYRTN